MKFAIKLIALLVVIILIVLSAYVICTNDDNDKDDNGGEKDTTAPIINSVTGNTTGVQGKKITIYTTFSDNVNVTKATLYYKKASSANWTEKSIFTGSATIDIPSESLEEWFYYITVDDKADNGPVGKPSTDGSKYYTITVVEDESQIPVHTVFIEDGTATGCINCPQVAKMLNDLYKSGEYNFYYVSMIDDKNSKAYDRLRQDYNIEGYPTVYIDGGYEVIVGSGKSVSFFKQKIATAESREVPDIRVIIKTEYDNNTKELDTEITVKNKEDTTFDGILKVYLTEITSRWFNPNGDVPYHYGFIDYLINEDISIDADEENLIPNTRVISDLDPENLMVIAVIFNSESVTRYSDANEGEKEKPFNAHFAVSTAGTEVVKGGNLPPSVGINVPVEEKLHIFSRPIIKTLLKNTVILGKTTITIFAEDDSEIQKIEVNVKGRFREFNETIYDKPYEWTWHKLAFGKYTITVTAYDDEGKTSTASIEVIAFML